MAVDNNPDDGLIISDLTILPPRGERADAQPTNTGALKQLTPIMADIVRDYF